MPGISGTRWVTPVDDRDRDVCLHILLDDLPHLAGRQLRGSNPWIQARAADRPASSGSFA